MLLLVAGAKGGLGATTLVRLLCRQADAVPLDAADGRLAADLSVPGANVLDLVDTPQWTVARRSYVADQVARTRQPLLWSRACSVWPDQVATFVADVAALTTVVADGGTAPPPNLVGLASLILIVSADDPVARWHEQRLKQKWPAALAVVGDLKAAAQAIATQTLGIPARKGLLERAHSTLRRTGVRSEQ